MRSLNYLHLFSTLNELCVRPEDYTFSDTADLHCQKCQFLKCENIKENIKKVILESNMGVLSLIKAIKIA